MIFGQYNEKSSYESILTHPIWNEALSWVHEHGETLSDGEHEVRGRNIYVNVQSLSTLQKSETAFEVHKQYIDIHYCITGGEIIEYSPMGDLQEKTKFDIEKDYQLFLPTEHSSICRMQPDSFAIFFPGELHMPKLQDGINPNIKKVVVKIKNTLLSS